MSLISQMDRMADALNGLHLTYSQPHRWDVVDKSAFVRAVVSRDLKAMIAALKRGKRCDCSSSCGIILAAGAPVDLTGTFFTGNFNARAKAAGCDILRYTGLKDVRHGDFLNSPGHHVVYKRGTGASGKYWSAESKVGYRTYTYPSVWDGRTTYVVRPQNSATWQGRTLAAYANQDAKTLAFALGILRKFSSWDGPRWAEFISDWKELDKGLALAYDPKSLTIPDSGHVFVVLGSTVEKMIPRLEVALKALQATTDDGTLRWPNSKVLVTGGKKRGNTTESGYMRDWLVQHGIAADRIIVENGATNTITNAKLSLPLMAGVFSTYTLVSDASHLRRAQVYFDAAQMQIETATNTRLALAPLRQLAYDDYAPRPVLTAQPVTAATREAIAAEVAALLGLSKPYAAAL